MTDKADNDALVRDELAAMRKREVQLIGAGISMRDWHATEIGYNQLRDRIDGFILCLAALRTPQPSHVDVLAARMGSKFVPHASHLAEAAAYSEGLIETEPTRPQPDETETLRAEVARLREALETAGGMLIRHHQWHVQQRTPDPEHGFIPADEYGDSALYEQTANAIDKVDKALATQAHEPSADVVEVRKVETVTGDFMQDEGEPFWRIEIGGYCADFDHEQAARNFAAAIAAMRPESERAEIMAWLRSLPNDEWYPDHVADAIERGDHIKEPSHD